MIDHLAVSSELEVLDVQGFSRDTPEGRLSDHDGVVVTLEPRAE